MSTRIQLEPEAQAFAEAAAKPPFLFNLDPEKGRIVLNEAQSSHMSASQVEIEDLTIDDGPIDHVAIRILRPLHAPTTLPVIVYIHGASWVFGSKQTHDRLMRELAVGARAAVVFPDYSLSPRGPISDGHRGMLCGGEMGC
jgi:acetyl esterase